MKKLIILAAVALAACSPAELISTGSQDARDLHAAGKDYIGEQFRYRVMIREMCWDMLQAQVRALEGDGEFDKARDLLARAYPHLALVDAITERDISKALGNLNEPSPCVVRPDPPPFVVVPDDPPLKGEKS